MRPTPVRPLTASAGTRLPYWRGRWLPRRPPSAGRIRVLAAAARSPRATRFPVATRVTTQYRDGQSRSQRLTIELDRQYCPVPYRLTRRPLRSVTEVANTVP